MNEKSEMPGGKPKAKPKFGSITRDQFKKSLLPFIGGVVTLFRHLQRFKKNSGGEKQTAKADAPETLAEQVNRINRLISY